MTLREILNQVKHDLEHAESVNLAALFGVGQAITKLNKSEREVSTGPTTRYYTGNRIVFDPEGDA